MTVQYGFSFETESDKESLKKNLSRFFSQPIDLTVTNNTSTYLTATEGKRGVINLRLHKMFLDANADVLRAISGYVQNKNRKASKVLDNYIDAHKHTIIRSQKSTRHF
ncbi:hypothetical protein KKA47_01950, partial [bacterium]|nr:hypothetical protein [bacterium]